MTATAVETNGQVDADLIDYSHLLSKAAESETIFRAKLIGLSPLLMHSPKGMQVTDDKVKGTREKRIPLPADEAETGAYRNEDGFLVIESVAVQRAMIEAAKDYKDPQRPRATLKTLVAAAITLPLDASFVIHGANDEPLTDYIIDTRRAVVQRAAVMRSRAKIAPPWWIEIQFGFDPTMIEMKHIAAILQTAGKRVGLLDYRPEKSGNFGRFRVENLSANV